MLRLTELKLPLDHTDEALEEALLARLGLPARDLEGFTVFRRAVDARKKSAIALIYTLDVTVRDEKGEPNASRATATSRSRPTWTTSSSRARPRERSGR